ncbi:fumarylacetoacetate hydrolase family protein [Bacillus sp. AFS055030]|uniref:2-keto-4-pentenoate hydratase n=1 Tax=Bacillus sp. AFS055030 TaxID=2033507 RepID=UPI000BFCCCAF|nr:fumarylacetoacetate hydrolase family protein [Bacillus sp. AFS055030]PGL72058.1 4-oxalocrotonate decarboxylase [Bacillus sp. AFS055030]
MITEIANKIYMHQKNGLEMDKITIEHPELNVNNAYEIQKLSIDNAIKNGDPLIGWKMGLTSIAKQKSVNVDEPIYGRLTKSMELKKNELKMEGSIHPRVEPEIAFMIKKPLFGHDVTAKDVWEATEYIVPALEVIDSRYKNFSFTLTDVVADNASSSKFIIGKQQYSPTYTSWDEINVELYKNGVKVQSGISSDVLDHPVESVVKLVQMLSKNGEQIEPGMIILTGGITEAIHVKEGDIVEARFDGIETMSLQVTR